MNKLSIYLSVLFFDTQNSGRGRSKTRSKCPCTLRWPYQASHYTICPSLIGNFLSFLVHKTTFCLPFYFVPLIGWYRYRQDCQSCGFFYAFCWQHACTISWCIKNTIHAAAAACVHYLADMYIKINTTHAVHALFTWLLNNMRRNSLIEIF